MPEPISTTTGIVRMGEALPPLREYDLEIQKRFMPVMSLAVARQRREMIVEAVSELMNEATEANNFQGDYGVIPGTKQKTLLQPGADKLNNLFGLVPRFENVKETLDWSGQDHNGEPFFFYEVRCTLLRGDFLMGEGIGSANSWESKWRYRKAERVCPECGKPAIIKGQAQYGGGWICWKKKDGCNAKFDDADQRITSQVVGNIANENIHDLVNTVLKIACKRAKIAATINATSAHEFFTQDIDDARVMPNQGETYEEVKLRKVSEAEAELAAQQRGRQQQKPAPKPEPKQPVERPDPAVLWPNEPPETQALWASMDTLKRAQNMLSMFYDQVVDLAGSDKPFYEMLEANGMKEKGEMWSAENRERTRGLARDLFYYIKRVRAANTPPAADDDREDWLPEGLGVTEGAAK